ncbi:MAG: Leucine-rich repeat (LRR) protein [Saprospiraceae bacterium]|jgi:Leucine-rich repeat (LRR) protein
MSISKQELEKIEHLLSSSDKANVELGLTILSGFTLEKNGIEWLWNYYQRLAQIEAINKPKYNLSNILTGMTVSEPTKVSRILTLLLEKTGKIEKDKIYHHFIKDSKMTLPRLEFTNFPESIFDFPELETIIWQYGNLESIPPTILNLPNLKYLDLRHQPLMEIDEKIVEHPSLEEIWIGNALIITEDIADSAKFEILIEAAY